VPRPLPETVCDSRKVAEVFRNLITNGIKYNDKPKRTVEIGFLEQSGEEKNVFYVRDNGLGIAAEHHEDVFSAVRRLRPVGGETGARGTGVGLTFVKKIIERSGGRIWLESKPGEGSTFYFTLGS
jgi:light-regulated signal transduction histidine kinase (bacteriophytochrome)